MKKKLVEQVEIIDIADKGKSVGRSGEEIIFIDGGVPGDFADVEIYKKHRSYSEGKAVRIIKPSRWRTSPFCEHFGICGGCKWQHFDYAGQLLYKEKLVRDAISRIAKVIPPPVEPISGCRKIQYYRNKLEFTFTDKRYLLSEEINGPVEKNMNGLGFHIPGMFSKVLNLNVCYLQDPFSETIRKFISDFTQQYKIPYFNLKTHQGVLRNLIIRNTSQGEWMVVVVFGSDVPSMRELLLKAVSDKFPELTSLMYIINTKKNDTVFDLEAVLYHGRAYIIEKMEERRFMIGPKSFFQTNTYQALELYKIARDYANLTGDEIVYDLYTGTGSIAAFISGQAKKVIGIDSVHDAINDAKQNALLNSIDNMEFYAGDMKDMLTEEFIAQHGKPDVVITDPPRAGMHEDVVKRILYSGAEKIVYVSCNPATQARDIAILLENYVLKTIRPVDMFPHTSHVESVALLVRKS